MKRIIQYILLILIGTVVSCQTPELVEEIPSYETGAGVYDRVPIIFKATIPGIEPGTKVMDHMPDIHSFHLVVFDQNGMFVEVAEAEIVGNPTMNNERDYVQAFRVVLTLSDQPRIIHFIANCPVDQITYGHEASIIGNMYVENGETAYWSRAEVPHVQVVDKVYDENTDAEHFHPCEHLEHHLEHVHLLRNFAEILVEDETGSNDPFQMMGFSVYNTIDKGTVAPYNNKSQDFQCFVDEEEAAKGNEVIYDYEELMNLTYPYEGHALSSALLNQNMPKRNNEYIWYGPDMTNPNKIQEHFFMYERKVSIRTDEEDKWRESPPHVIVKAKYNNEECYYKFDLVYNIEGNGVVTDIKYYHILRNFLYRFKIKNVHSKGYATPEEAIKGITSNNLSGSTTTSGLKEVAVGQNRISVSYTDTTVVNSGPINFRYKYEPNYATSKTIANSSEYVKLVNVNGDVIASHSVAQTDIGGEGEWSGFRNVVLNIAEPGNTIVEQVFTVRPQDYQLTRKIRVILRKKLKMIVDCLPRIKSGIDVPQEVQIKIQPGLTSDMFPLQLAIETQNLSLSPDATKNSIPVQPGKSTIPSKNGKDSFYYIYTIDTYDDYNNVEKYPRDENNYRIINTYWRTSCVANASTVYVTNKYFDTENASDSWTNVSYAWSNVAVSTQNIPKGLDREVSITFTKDASDNQQRQVTIVLDGLKDANGNTTITRTLAANEKNITISGLKTTTEEGKVGFTLDNTSYMLASATSGDRVGNRFENAGFVQGSVGLGVGNEVQYNFTVPTYYAGMEINVTLDGLAPADDETRLESPADGRSAIKSYVFKPTATGTYTLKLKTANKDESTCSLTLEAEKYYYETVRSTINQTAAKYAFQSLTTNPSGSVRYGTGRTVSITFVLDASDNGYKNKDVYVKLVGMADNQGRTSFTHNVGNNRQVTINNLVTTSDDGILRVTVEAAEYLPITATISERTPGEFKNVKFNKTKVGSKVGEVVELSFNIDNNSYYTGMVVNLELNGLEPVDGNYTYTVTKSGDHKINLRTTQAVDGECTAQLKAAGMTDSQVVTVQQAARTAVPIFSSDFSNNNNPFDLWNANNASMSINNGRLRVQVNSKGTNVYEPQLVRNCGDNSFVDGRVYYLKFKLSGTNRGNAADNHIYAKMQDNNSNYRVALEFDPIEVTATERIVTLEGKCNGTGNYLVIHLGWFVGDIYIDDFEFGYYE